jgi:cobalt-zinc-cadmium efflux system membrane fusion protein
MRRALLLVIVATLLSSCGGQPPAGADLSSAKTAATATAAFFTVPAEQLAHLTIAPARKTSWSKVVRTTGTVDWDNDRTTQAITQVSGPITRIVVDTGTRVKAGDPLLYVASTDLTGAISTYRKAKSRFDLAGRTFNRTKDLVAHKAMSQRDYESAEADYDDAATDLQAALQALKILGVREAEIAEAERQNVPIAPELVMRAPLGGTIVQKMVLPGQFIQAGTTLAFVITDTSTLWVQGHVNDKDIGSVQVGDQVEIRNASFPGTFHGVISYIGDLIDPATRTTSVRIVTQNPGGLLKKDLFVDVVIRDRTTHEVLVVPTTAVLYDDENLPFVFAQVSPGKFAQRLVKIGGQQGEDTQILDGVKAGDPVVTQGSVFLQFANMSQQ